MMYSMLARLAIRYRKAIICFWVVVLIASVGSAIRFPAVLTDSGLKTSGSYERTSQIMSEHFHQSEHPVLLLFENQGSASDEQFHMFIASVLSSMAGVDGLQGVLSPIEHPDMRSGRWAYAALSFKQPTHLMKEVLDDVQGRIPLSPDFAVKLTGKDAVWMDVSESSQKDLFKAEWIGIPLAFAILWLAFGGFLSSLIPILIGLIGVVGTFGILYQVGQSVDLSLFVLNVIPMVGLALSIDFALLFVSRFREEYENRSLQEALTITMVTAGRTVLFSSFCFLLGLGGMLFIRLPIFYTVVVGAMIVLILSLLLTLTLVPALLAMLSHKIKKEHARRQAKGVRVARESSWYRLAGWLMKRPVLSGLLALVVLVIGVLPLGRLQLAIPDATSLPAHYESRQAAEMIEEHMSLQDRSQVFFVLEGDWKSQNSPWQSAYQLVQDLMRDPRVIAVESLFGHLPVNPAHVPVVYRDDAMRLGYESLLGRFVQENYMLIVTDIGSSSQSKTARNWVRDQENRLAKQDTDLNIFIGGEAKYEQEIFDQIADHLLFALLFILVTIYFVMLVAFRSVWVPFKTIIINLLTIAASFGLVTAIFQAGPFGWEATDIAIMIPVFIFGLTFGISLDYGIFLIFRMAEIYRKTKDNDRAVLEGLAATGKIITSAAAIMIAVTAPFAWGEVAGVKQLGVGIALTILIDATLVRLLLVPSLMKAMGKWNWWFPRNLR